MAEFIEILILSAIQGISECIPVSSSAHLYLMSEVQNFEIKSLLTDVSLHLGSLLAILFYFRDDFLKLFKDQKSLVLQKLLLLNQGVLCSRQLFPIS